MSERELAERLDEQDIGRSESTDDGQAKSNDAMLAIRSRTDRKTTIQPSSEGVSANYDSETIIIRMKAI